MPLYTIHSDYMATGTWSMSEQRKLLDRSGKMKIVNKWLTYGAGMI